MPKASPILTSFNAGELSPSLDGRVDLSKYSAGCKRLENFIPMVQGPARRRSGTRFVNEVKTSANRTWLVRFEFSETQAYILEFGNQYIRFYTNHGQVISGGSAFEIASPYTSADLSNANGTLRIRFVQSGDVVYIVHPSYAPRKLSRFGPVNWTLTTVDFEGGPFIDIDPDQTTTVFASATTGTVTLTSSAPIFASTDVGGLLLLEGKDGGSIKPWESQKDFGVNVNPFGERRRSDGKIYRCTTNAAPPAGEAYYTGSTKPTHTSGAFIDGSGQITGTSLDGPIGVEWTYESLDYGIVKITGFTSATSVTGVVQQTLPTNVVYSPAGSAKTVTAIAATSQDLIRLTVTAHGYVIGSTVNIALTSTYNWNRQDDSVSCGGTGALIATSSNEIVSGTFEAYVVDANTIDMLASDYSATITSTTINYTYQDDLGSGCETISTTAVGTFSAYVSGTVTQIAVGSTANLTPRWAFSRWSPTRGWPSQVAFFRERLVFATNQTIDMSVAADFENFSDRNTSGEVSADMAIAIEVSSDTVNTIEWLSPSDGLLIGTAGGEFVCGEVTTDEPLGPGNVKITQQSLFGSKSVIPCQIGDQVIFIQRSGRKARELTYDFGSNGYKSSDLTVLSEHISASGIVDIVYQQEPHSIIWAVRDDGLLIGFTYNKEQEVLGWHRHPIGGNGIVECVESIPNPNGTQDDLWMIVRRTINGQTKRYIEYLEADFTSDSALPDAFFVDSGLTYDGVPVSSVSGLNHLEGQTVSVLVDGAMHPTRVVTGGAISLQVAGSKIHAGLAAPAVLQTMRLEAGAGDGTAQGKTKRITKAVIRFLATLGAKAGADESQLDEIQFRKPSDPMGQPPALFTGDQMVEWPNGYDFDGYLMVKQDQPLPMTVVAIMPQVHTQDR
jgi:hypothetical protein